SDPYEDHLRRPLAEHLADFAAALKAKGNSPRHCDLTEGCIRAVLDGTGAAHFSDLDAGKVADWLNRLRSGKRGRPELPADQNEFTPRETALLLDITVSGVGAAVRRLGLAATGNGKKRRLPRETVEALIERSDRGASPETVNHYVRAVRSFLRWL